MRIYLSYNIHKAKTIIVNKVLMKSEIINKLDELYSNYLVYRTIIVCDDSSQDNYVNILKDNNYDNYVLKEYDMTIDYNTLDVRIFLIEKKYFINFIKRYIDDKINANIDINMTYFYNSIIIHFDNDEYDIIKETDKIKSEYNEISNNNDIII